jgi:hypothetical protein
MEKPKGFVECRNLCTHFGLKTKTSLRTYEVIAPVIYKAYMAGKNKRPPNLKNTTDALQCPECEQNGESGMNFCANCGRQLWHR